MSTLFWLAHRAPDGLPMGLGVYGDPWVRPMEPRSTRGAHGHTWGANQSFENIVENKLGNGFGNKFGNWFGNKCGNTFGSRLANRFGIELETSWETSLSVS